MKFSTIFLSAIASTSALAAPAVSDDSVSMMAATPQWTIRDFKRYCNPKDTTCYYKFGVDTGNGKTTPCKYQVDGAKASRKDTGPNNCGDYTITSAWSGQFGEGNGFTTLSVVNNKNRYIVWPAYTDKQLSKNDIVKPDQAYAPAKLP